MFWIFFLLDFLPILTSMEVNIPAAFVAAISMLSIETKYQWIPSIHQWQPPRSKASGKSVGPWPAYTPALVGNLALLDGKRDQM